LAGKLLLIFATSKGRKTMAVSLKDLFTTDIGLLSVFTIGFILVMGVYIYGYAKKHMEDDARNAK
jgi:hypothetical protein